MMAHEGRFPRWGGGSPVWGIKSPWEMTSGTCCPRVKALGSQTRLGWGRRLGWRARWQQRPQSVLVSPSRLGTWPHSRPSVLLQTPSGGSLCHTATQGPLRSGSESRLAKCRSPGDRRWSTLGSAGSVLGPGLACPLPAGPRLLPEAHRPCSWGPRGSWGWMGAGEEIHGSSDCRQRHRVWGLHAGQQLTSQGPPWRPAGRAPQTQIQVWPCEEHQVPGVRGAQN